MVESWIGAEGTRAAGTEFQQGHYRLIVATGGFTGRSWSQERWKLSLGAENVLTAMGIPKEQIIRTADKDLEFHRTYDTAAEVRAELERRGVKPRTVTVFTMAAHARRSRLVYVKVFGSATPVGCVAWLPPGYNSGPWWRSTIRTEEFLKEMVVYLFELLLNSGRI